MRRMLATIAAMMRRVHLSNEDLELAEEACRRDGGLKNEAYTRGLRFAFEPLAPERGVSTFPPATIR